MIVNNAKFKKAMAVVENARECSFFERNDNPPPAFKPVGQK